MTGREPTHSRTPEPTAARSEHPQDPSHSALAYQKLLAQLGLEHPTDLPESFYRGLARKLGYFHDGGVCDEREPQPDADSGQSQH